MKEEKTDFNAVLKFYERGMYQESFNTAMSLAKRGDADAQVFLGWLYLKGYAGQINEQEALRWYMAGAAQGNTDAQYALGNYFKVKKDYLLAYEWYKLASDSTHLPSLYNLGLLYEYGLGVKKDQQQALKLFRVAASKGHLFSKKKISMYLIKSKNLLRKLRGLLMFPSMLVLAVWFVLRSRYDERTLE